MFPNQRQLFQFLRTAITIIHDHVYPLPTSLTPFLQFPSIENPILKVTSLHTPRVHESNLHPVSPRRLTRSSTSLRSLVSDNAGAHLPNLQWDLAVACSTLEPVHALETPGLGFLARLPQHRSFANSGETLILRPNAKVYQQDLDGSL